MKNNIFKRLSYIAFAFSISCSEIGSKEIMALRLAQRIGLNNKLKTKIPYMINMSAKRNLMNASIENIDSFKESNELLKSFFIENYEKVVFHKNKETNLNAIVIIDDTTLGPGLGGCRFLNYKGPTNEISYLNALNDVKRLARGMTYKSSLAGINLGGGKSVIIGDPQTKNEDLLRSFGAFVNSLDGAYVTAPDVNTNEEDMAIISKETKYVASLPSRTGGGGDPSEFTAYGVYLSMKAAAKNLYGNESLKGKKILIDGVGKVGSFLIEKHLSKEDADIYIADISSKAINKITNNYNVTVVNNDKKFDLDMEIYSPCALGGILNDQTINRLKCKLIVGGANNQLENEVEHDIMLYNKDIMYVPDFLANAGGIINCESEFYGNYSINSVMEKVENIYNTCNKVLKLSKEKDLPTQKIAIELAKERINNMKKLK